MPGCDTGTMKFLLLARVVGTRLTICCTFAGLAQPMQKLKTLPSLILKTLSPLPSASLLMKLVFGPEASFRLICLLKLLLGIATKPRMSPFLKFLFPPTFLGVVPYMEMPLEANFRHILP